MRSLVLAIAFFALSAAAHAQTAPIHEALDAYALYQTDITAMLDADISDAAALNAALERAARHDPARVAAGWLAYGGLTAAQSPAWVNGVRSRVRAAGRAAVLRQLRRDLGYARRRPPRSAEATQLVLRANAADTARMRALAVRFEGMGAAADTSAWARRGSDRAERLRASDTRTLPPALIARLHIAPLTAAPLTEPEAFGGSRFWDALSNRASPRPVALPWRLNAARASTLDRMFTLGALMVIGAGSDDQARNRALDDETTRQCLTLQQLFLRQCAGVTHDPNEDAYCLARHGFSEPAACFALAVAP
ncbi:MAG: hypothetical protein ACT4OF_03600 [Caulobacteraceae bacterium]